MARNNRFSRKQYKTTLRPARQTAEATVARPLERKPPTQYGKPFILLEDVEKNTFEYANGAWIPYAMTIAECREQCQVKMLPQQVNGKTRYEVRCPIPIA